MFDPPLNLSDHFEPLEKGQAIIHRHKEIPLAVRTGFSSRFQIGLPTSLWSFSALAHPEWSGLLIEDFPCLRQQYPKLLLFILYHTESRYKRRTSLYVRRKHLYGSGGRRSGWEYFKWGCRSLIKNGSRGGNRTPDQAVNSRPLCLAELPGNVGVL